MESTQKNPLRRNWNASPGFASSNAFSSLHPCNTVNEFGFRFKVPSSFNLPFLHPRYSHINEPQHQLHFLLIPNVSFLLPFFLRILNHSWLQDHRYSEQLLHFHLHPSHILYRLQICILQTYLIAREQTEIFLRRFFHEIISFNIEIFAECNFSGACFLIFLIISTGRYST